MGRGRKSGPGRQNQVCKSLEEGPREPGEAVKLLRREWSGKGMESWMGGQITQALEASGFMS